MATAKKRIPRRLRGKHTHTKKQMKGGLKDYLYADQEYLKKFLHCYSNKVSKFTRMVRPPDSCKSIKNTGLTYRLTYDIEQKILFELTKDIIKYLSEIKNKSSLYPKNYSGLIDKILKKYEIYTYQIKPLEATPLNIPTKVQLSEESPVEEQQMEAQPEVPTMEAQQMNSQAPEVSTNRIKSGGSQSLEDDNNNVGMYLQELILSDVDFDNSEYEKYSDYFSTTNYAINGSDNVLVFSAKLYVTKDMYNKLFLLITEILKLYSYEENKFIKEMSIKMETQGITETPNNYKNYFSYVYNLFKAFKIDENNIPRVIRNINLPRFVETVEQPSETLPNIIEENYENEDIEDTDEEYNKFQDSSISPLVMGPSQQNLDNELDSENPYAGTSYSSESNYPYTESPVVSSSPRTPVSTPISTPSSPAQITQPTKKKGLLGIGFMGLGGGNRRRTKKRHGKSHRKRQTKKH